MRSESPGEGGAALPVLRGCLIVSLPEDPEEEGLERLRRDVLDALRGRAVEGVAFDMGAVRMIDPPLFRHLAETARMVALLGGEPVFAGFRPGAAAVLVDLDADVSGVRAFRTLEEAIGAAAPGGRARDRAAPAGEDEAGGPGEGRGRAGLGADGSGAADRAP